MLVVITNVPYHLPDEVAIGSCTIRFSIPNDPKWATVLIGAISELARLELWEAGTGGITAQQAIVTALEIRESVEFSGCTAMQIKVGSYTGNGSATQAISGVGFLPVVVITWMRDGGDANRGLAIKATPDSSAFSIGRDGNDYESNISTFDADGFEVKNQGAGGEYNGNKSGKNYSYVAIGE